MAGTVPSPAAPAALTPRPRRPPEAHPSYRLQSGAAQSALQSLRSAPEHHFIRRTDCVMRVMTDFAASPAFTIGADCAVDDALDEMFRRGVRALLVLDGEDAVVGLITSYDIQGERAQQYLEDQPERRREELRVREILTPCGAWTSIDWHGAQSARVGDVLAIFRSTNSPYLIVLEASTETAPGLLRGIISRTHLERQLGESP
jgi:CBS-domain-containing membrane protein